MIYATVSGRITKDAETRTAGSDQVCSFSVASNKKVRGENSTMFVDASMWGKRGVALMPHLKKGTAVTVVGELTTREHNGKTYLGLRVAELDFMGGGTRGATKPPAGDDGTYDGPDYGAKPSATDDDPLPF